MRNRFRVLTLLTIAAAVIALPIFIAVSSRARAPRAAEPATPVMAATVVAVPAVVQSGSGVTQPVPEGATLFVVGAVLIGVAAAVRRSARPGLRARE
jgi:hypothetical protein